MNKQALIARIHIAKSKAKVCDICERLVFGNECPACKTDRLSSFPEARYRSILITAGGSSSCSTMGDRGLVRVMEVFDRAGFTTAYPYLSPEKEQARQRQNVIRHIEIRAPMVLSTSWEARIQGFVKKSFDKPSLQFCSSEELRKVIGWINRTAKYQSKSKEDKK